ncbi:MAG: glycosyltransferase family 2 protein [Gammaproteobacteria bacterium]
MTYLVWTAAGGLILLGLMETVLSLRLMRFLARRPEQELHAGTLPGAAVILPLRGADPSLRDCLHSLLQQDYTGYSLHVVVDSRQDPAWDLVNAEMRKATDDRLRLHVLDTIPASCSLKCAGLAEVAGHLDKDTDIVVLVDADTMPSSTWLRRMVNGLRQSGASAVSGMRWFVPRGNSMAAFVRYLWNAGSVVQMYRHGIAWGGCLAFERKLFEETDLVDRLRHAYGEDTLLDSVLRKHDLAMVFDPSLVLLTREDTSFTGFLGWACRQMISVRLHHSGWFKILLFGLLQWLLLLSCLILALQGLWTGDTTQAGIAGLTLLGYALLQSLLLLVGESMISHRIAVGEKTQSPLSRLQTFMLPAAILLTQILHGFILLAAVFRKTVTWRGIPYRIEGKGKIRLLSYTPYVQEQNTKNRSL